MAVSSLFVLLEYKTVDVERKLTYTHNR